MIIEKKICANSRNFYEKKNGFIVEKILYPSGFCNSLLNVCVRERERERETERQTDRQTERETERERDPTGLCDSLLNMCVRERERERVCTRTKHGICSL